MALRCSVQHLRAEARYHAGMHNPYEPPRADLIDKSRPPGSIPRAVAVGVIIDLGGTFLVSLAAILPYAAFLMSQGRTETEVAQAIGALVPWSGYGLVPAILGTIMSLLAGYQCAAIANRTNYLAPGILSAISTAASAYAGGRAHPAWILSVMSGITVAVTLGGAWLYMRRIADRA
jgi:hypothetical protein